MIEVAHLTRRFGALVAVDDLSFRLEQGEVVGFLGPNGAGKTTTMRILTGYLPATSAQEVSVAGFDVLRRSLEVRRRIGYLPEAVPLYGEMRVREMMRFQGRLHGIDRAGLRRRVPEVLERVGVADRSRRGCGALLLRDGAIAIGGLAAGLGAWSAGPGPRAMGGLACCARGGWAPGVGPSAIAGLGDASGPGGGPSAIGALGGCFAVGVGPKAIGALTCPAGGSGERAPETTGI